MAEEAKYRPVPLRRRLLIALLAVATAATLILMMLERVGAPEIPRPPAAAGPAPCAEGQTSGCVGGRADVILVPAVAPAAAGASAAR